MKIIRIIFKSFPLLVTASILALMPILSGCDIVENTTSTTTSTIPFAIHVTPVHMDDTIAGQSYVFLVTVDYGTEEVETTTVNGTETTKNLVTISASADNATVTVGPEVIAEGSIAEVVVIPDESTTGTTITVNVKGEWNGLEDTEIVTLNVREASESLEDLTLEAVKIRNLFVVWLATNYPDLDITMETVWSGTSVYPNTTIIKYFLFFSDEWEIGIRWNTSDDSVDWAQMYIRLRTAEFSPSQAFEIASISATDIDVYEISPPEEIWR